MRKKKTTSDIIMNSLAKKSADDIDYAFIRKENPKEVKDYYEEEVEQLEKDK